MLANPQKDSSGRVRDHSIELPDRWVQLHVLKRNTLFVPTGTSDGPSETDIQHLRHTALYNGTWANENRKSHFDNWTSARLGSRKIDFTWTGATIFYKKDVTADFLHDLRTKLNSERLDTDDIYPTQQDLTAYEMRRSLMIRDLNFNLTLPHHLRFHRTSLMKRRTRRHSKRRMNQLRPRDNLTISLTCHTGTGASTVWKVS